jgi:hypothetical protein
MGTVKKNMTAAILSLLLASAASADEVVLKNGSAFSGIVREEGDRVVVEMDFGTMSFKKVDVRSISRGLDPIHEFDEKLKAAKDVKGMLELAGWAREKGLGTRSQELYRKILTLDPDQAEARKVLGFEKVNGQWLAGDDLMVARGFVKVSGRWLTKETAELMLEQDAQAKMENERIQLAKRMADQRHSEEMSRIGLERERLEVEKQRSDYWGWRNGYYYGSAPWNGVGGYVTPVILPPPQPIPPTPPTVVPLGQPSPLPPSRPR